MVCVRRSPSTSWLLYVTAARHLLTPGKGNWHLDAVVDRLGHHCLLASSPVPSVACYLHQTI